MCDVGPVHGLLTELSNWVLFEVRPTGSLQANQPVKAVISYSSVKSCFSQDTASNFHIVVLEDVKDMVAFIAALFVAGACFVSCLTHEGSSNGHLCTAGFVELLSICSLRHHSHQWLFMWSYLHVLHGSECFCMQIFIRSQESGCKSNWTHTAPDWTVLLRSSDFPSPCGSLLHPASATLMNACDFRNAQSFCRLPAVLTSSCKEV